MFGIRGKDLEPIHRVAKILHPDCDTNKLGAWGILFLCCGAMAVQNSLWRDRAKSSGILIRPTDLIKVLEGSNVCTSDDYAVRFSEFIKEWSNDSHAVAFAEKRLEEHRGRVKDSTFLCYKAYVTLAFMLNSLHEMSRKELLGFDCRTWVSVSSTEQHNYGWPELFFAAGLLLNAEESVRWEKMASAIHGTAELHKGDVKALFEHYSGKSQLSKSGRTRIRTDQLKKGMRVRLRNGWEALVVQECNGNTLLAKVFGDFTETGSIYAHNVAAAMVDGKWVDVEMTAEQLQFYKETRSFFEPDGQ
jgi:hypothetical protein